MLDEVHERNINIDLCISILSLEKKLKLPKLANIKVILCSATVNIDLKKFFNNSECGVFDISFQNNLVNELHTPHEYPVFLANEVS